MTLRRVLAWSAVVAVLTTLLVMLASTSHAEPKQLLVGNSPTGPFNGNLSRPLFHGEGPYVPRDRVTSTFWVKNNSHQVARATLAVVNRGGSNAFEEALSFDVDIDGVHSTASLPAPDRDGCRLITTGPDIEPGAVQAVDVTLLVADLEQQVGMKQAASVDFVVTLSQLGNNGQVKVCGDQAEADPPDVKGAQTDSGQCTDDVVVTVVGTPTCVPTVVDAGRAAPSGGPVRDAGVVGLAAGVLLGTGVLLLTWGSRRRNGETTRDR